jgi:hypothetical protein
MVPGKEAAAYNAPSLGTVVSDQEYSGVTPVNEGGNHIPVRYELPVEQNTMIRLILYTDSESDCSINIENQNSPYEEADRFGSFPGSNLTAVNDFYNPAPNVYSTSSFGVTADRRNTAAYTEVFGDIAKVIFTLSSEVLAIVLKL